MSRHNRRVVESSEMIVSSRLLVLQSKRLLLQREMRTLGSPDVRRKRTPEDVARRTGEVEAAQDRYRDAVLRHGSVDSSQYWLVAYGLLVAEAEQLSESMRRAEGKFAGAERAELSQDAAKLQDIIDGWRELLAQTITDEVA